MLKHKGTLLSILLFLLLFSGALFSQARLNINNGAFVSMGGGSSTSPVYLVVGNGNANAIARTTSGHIISENEFNKIKWNIGTNTGLYQFPMGKGTANYFPFYFNKTSAGVCPVSPCSYTVSSWYTLDNIVWPSSVTSLNPSEASIVDRFWLANFSGYTTNPSSDIRFYYLTGELDGLTEADLQAQYWNSTTSGWEPPVGTVNVVAKYVEVSGANTSHPWTLSNTLDPLPVELLSFNAVWSDKSHSSALLKWVTATEINNDYFELQRSIDATNFIAVGRVNSLGNSFSKRSYKYVDTLIKPNSDTTIFYYRIKQVDFDGGFSYSNIVALADEINYTSLSVFPNPTVAIVNLQISSSETGDAEVSIINSLSQSAINKKIKIENGINNYSFNVSELARGIYTVRVLTKNNSSIYKISIN